MKNSLRFTWRVVSVLILPGGLTVVVLNQDAIIKLRAENEALLGGQQEAQRLELENQEIPRLRQDADEIEKLRAENQALPKLRNDVRQLRRQAGELAALRAENQRLLANGKATERPDVPAPLPADFLLRSNLRDAGLGTPEAAIQTFFWAMCQGNVERVSQCILERTPGIRYGDVDVQRQDLLKEWSRFSGFRIASKKENAPDTVLISLQTSPGGTEMQRIIKRVGNEWKLEE
ncbi:MAG: hypothetical protein JWR69_2363 [Pedosphaera sp.]|nr:hypothetical protein [Pedosphaera sp.]